MIFGVALVLVGAFTIVTARRRAMDAQRRMHIGEDRYFEERRALAAYPQLRDMKFFRWSGWLTLISGLLLLAKEIM
jgi:hypothetical protein|tara:strand:+ start:555 stop:782 length:228 start_codon:yes stop_codon:yes gene_type:complete